MFKRMLAMLLCLMALIPAYAEEDDQDPVTTVPVALTEPVEETQDSITLSFLGDCSIGDTIQFRDYKVCYHSTIAEKGYAWPFSLVKDVLAADDLTVANLEVVLTTETKHRDKKYNLVGKPEFVNVLKEGSIEIVNTANNHAYDFHAAGYLEMLKILDEAEFDHFGSLYYNNKKTGSDVCPIVDVKGVKVGFIGISYPQEFDKNHITKCIKSLREDGAQLVVVSLHWGRETKAQPEAGQEKLARYCIDAGADMIYGHHAHVLQTVQFYKGKPIFYSTGNFTFGTMSKVDPDTGIFQLTYDIVDGEPVLRRFSVVPCRTQGSGDYRPYILTDAEEITKMRKKLVHKRKDGRKVADKMTTVTDFFIENGYMEFEDGIAVGE